MTVKISRLFGVCLFLSLASTLTTAGSLEVGVNYEGPGPVDGEHRLYVFLVEEMPLGSTQPVGLQVGEANGISLVFEDVTSPIVYVVALYDSNGGFAGAGLPPLDSPAAIYGANGKPEAVQIGNGTTRVALRFDGSTQLAGLLPGPEVDRDKLESAAGIVEIRMYKIKPGMRDRFVRFFEEKTLAPQGAVGMRILGQFRSLMDDDTFVWVRAFESETERARQTLAFYGGTLWREELAAEAGSMLESTDVILVEPTPRSPMR